MSFCMTPEQLRQLRDTHTMPEFTGAELLTAVFETDPAVARELLPRPLSPTPDPTGVAFVAHYPKTNFGCVYNEGALFLTCRYKGEDGLYCLSMPVDDDMAMIGGRENFGYPKKIAERITLGRDGASVVGSVTRRGTEILRIECELSGEAPADAMDSIMLRATDWDGVACHKAVVFLFKHFPGPDGASFDYLPRLVREAVLFRPTAPLQLGQGQVTLASSPRDPLGEVPVGRVTHVIHGTYNTTMLPGRVVARVWNPFRFLRHAFFKVDGAQDMLQDYDPERTARVREIRRKARRY